MERLLILEDGSVYRGQGFGSDDLKTGELVFNTSMTGYQEILTDNSYCGQIVMMTYPLIGNYGINRDDYESIEPAVFGFVTRDLCQSPNNWRSQETLDDFLKAHNIPGIYDVDTRAITRKLRNKGTMRAMLANPDTDIEAAVRQLQETDYLHDQVARVSSSKIFPIPNRGHKVVLMDFGAKLGIVRELSRRGCDLIVVPWDTDAQTILSYHPDGVMLSNGPGDPEDVPQAIETIRQLMGKTVIFGICLGHQLISLACGAKTYKLKFGHRGANHPVVDLETGKVDITSQNHGFAVDIDSLADTELELTHKALNDGSCEGVRHKELPVFSVQFHPEASAGPEDTAYLFDKFVAMMDKEGRHA
ncbi:glutamine-hydrolyzing carbamoyl-phosphate synthase small subunit [Faecalibaculum rodentium]|jgi:carbamoyl-phosphate synthase small subunit|uniref:Carbamoyl phosphate synthase small chain n=3 Tax=Faecalibaculum rodentium TaxID=1702221 RepID=A0A140DRL6_9FIRM|nr:glutamine-hydrolyzing carbamoyl-phosphate synthase small subunit [Faecalibaculum rodentium]AMK53293.1 carbamoyl-phosphate synthase, small subunit [Faecalibaculum rodentium]